jgi:Inner membrane protein YgaP-like, transmembrane domain
MMTRNINSMDKIARIVLGIILGGLGIFLQPQFGLVGLIVPIVIGLILVATVFLNFCPIYSALGLSTCPDGEC